MDYLGRARAQRYFIQDGLFGRERALIVVQMNFIELNKKKLKQLNQRQLKYKDIM